MACLCIGGVCIPYSAILPLLLMALQYLALPLAKAGLLPKSIIDRLNLNLNTEDGDESSSGDGKSSSSSCKNGENSTCCTPATNSQNDGTSTKRDKRSKNQSPTTTQTQNNSDRPTIANVESMEEYKTLISTTPKVVIKFTADWCKPCKAIHPFFARKAQSYADRVQFAVIDVDECDDVAAECKVGMMPTFCAFHNGALCDSMSGSNEGKLDSFLARFLD